MTVPPELVRALYGAFRLARFDADGMTYLDQTVGACWRSFFAAVLVLPLYATLLVAQFATGQVAADGFRFAVVEAIAYVIGWLLFPVAMATVAPMMGRNERYVGFIVAYNWASVWQNTVILPIAILGTVGILPAPGGEFLSLVAFCYVLAYGWFVARTALDVPGSWAAGLVVLDLFLSFLLKGASEGLLGSGG
jgi:hypothetical protein